MRRAVLPNLILAVTTAALFGGLAAWLPALRAGPLRALLLVVAALGLHAGLRVLLAAFPKAAPPPASRSCRPARRPADLEQLERRVRLATSNAADAWVLRRHLRQVAEQRLASGHGIDLATQPDAARAVLGAELSALVGPDLDRPPQRHGPGLEVATLRDAIGRLERT